MAKPTLDDLVTPTPSSWGRDFRVPKLPAMRDSLSGKPLMDGIAAHDQALEKWRADVEKSIAERIGTQTPAAAAAAPAVAATTTTSQPAAPAATKALTTSDVPEGSNLYFTTQRVLDTLRNPSATTPNNIGPMETWTIPGQHNVVIAGPFTVQGTFQVDGYVAFLPIP